MYLGLDLSVPGVATTGGTANPRFAIDATGAQIRAAMSDVTAYASGGWRIPGTANARINASARTSAAMQQRADGVWEFAAHNLLTYSEQFDNAAWSKFRSSVTANAVVAPDGTTTADLLAEDATASNTHGLSRTVTVVSGETYTFSVYLKAGTRSWVALDIGGGVYFDASTGAFGTTASGYTTSATPAGNGWYRVAITRAASSTSIFPTIELATADNAKSYTGDGTSGIFIWGAQLNLGPAPTAYVPTTTAAVYAPAIDWLSAQGAYGLRSEAAATNLLTYSGGLTLVAGGWSGAGVSGTLSANTSDVVAPDGTSTAMKYAAAGDEYLQQTVTTAASTVYTYSFYVKSPLGTNVALNVYDGAVDHIVNFDVSTATFNSASNITSYGSIALSGGWWRIHAVFTSSGSASTLVRVRPRQSGTFYIWGAQLETGSLATSPILTYGATATRAADAVVVPDSGWVGQAAGTVVVDYVPQVANSATIASINDTTANEQIVLSNDGVLTVTDGGAAQATPDAGTPTAAARNRMAAAYAANDFAVTLNGGAAATDTSGTLPTTTRLSLGELNGTVTRIRYVARRLPDATLRALST